MVSNQAIIRDLKSYLLSVLGDKIKDVILFGSRADGRSSGDSDYGSFVEFNPEAVKSLFDDMEVFNAAIEEWINNN